MKPSFRIASLVIFMLLSFACSKGVTSMYIIDQDYVDGYLTVRLGETHNVGLMVEPVTAYEHLSWSSSDPEVATAEMGYVVGRSEGIATITVKSPNGKTLEFMVQVVKVKITSWNAPASLTLVPGRWAKLSVTINEPEGADISNLIPEIIENPSGYFSTWFEEGELCVGCRAAAPTDGSYTSKLLLYNSDKSSHTTTVLKAQYTPVTSVSLNTSSISELMTGASYYLAATLSPSGASIKDVIWSVSPSGIVSLEPDGLKCRVTAASAGTATVKVVAEDGNKSASCTINVVEAYVKSLKAGFAEGQMALCIGGKTPLSTQRTINVTVNPDTFTPVITNLTPSILELDGNIVKNPKSAGLGRISVKAGVKEEILEIRVVNSSAAFSLGISEEVYEGSRYIARTSQNVLPSRNCYLYTIFGEEHVGYGEMKYFGDAFGFGNISSSNNSGWSMSQYDKENDPVVTAPSDLGSTTTVTSSWGSKTASCKLTTAISSFTLGLGSDYKSGTTVTCGGTFNLSKKVVVEDLGGGSYVSQRLCFTVNSTNVYNPDNSFLSGEAMIYDNFALKCKSAPSGSDYTFNASNNTISFNPRSATGTYEFYLVNYPDKSFKINLTN